MAAYADFLEANQSILVSLFSEASWSEFQKLVQSYNFGDAQAKLDHALSNLPA